MIRVRHLPAFLLLLAIVPGCGDEKRLSTSSDEALRAYHEGVQQWQLFYYKEALRSFDKAIAADSAFAMAWARYSLVCRYAKDDAEARRRLDRAIALAPSASRREQLYIALWDAFQRYNMHGARELADSLVKLYPDDSEAHLFLGQTKEIAQDYEGALKEYQEAVRIDTGYALAVMSLGYTYSYVGENDKALDYMQRYIAMAPEAADPQASYADLLFHAGRYDEALEHYEASLKLKPDYWYAMRARGNIYLQQGRLREGREEIHRSFEALAQPQSVVATRVALDAYLDMGRGKYAEAEKLYRGALALDSLNGEAAHGLVTALAKLHRFEEAHRVADQILEVYRKRNLTETSGMINYHLVVARLLIEEGDLDGAWVRCDSALGYATSLNRDVVYQRQAEIHLLRKEYEPALDALELALTRNPNAPDALLLVAKVYHAMGDRRMTEEVGQRLLTFWSKADDDFLKKNELLKLLGRRPARP